MRTASCTVDDAECGYDSEMRYKPQINLLYLFTIEGEIGYLVRVHINLMDEAGDTFQETLRAGKKVEAAGEASELVGDIGKGIKKNPDVSIKNIDDFIEGKKSFNDVMDDCAEIYANKINSNQAES